MMDLAEVPAARPAQRVFLVGDAPRLARAILKQSGLRLTGQVPNLTLLLPLLRDCPADTLLISADALEDWPAEQALPRLRALNPELRLALILDPAVELPSDPDWRFSLQASPGQVARSLLSRPPSTMNTSGVDVAGQDEPALPGGVAPPARLLRLFSRHGQEHGDAWEQQGAAAQAASPALPSVIAVCGPKGGCGKTTVAVNLAVTLARQYPGAVLLADLSLAATDVGLHLDLLDGPTLVDALPYSPEGEVELLLPYVQRHKPTGLQVLLGPPRADLGELVRVEAVSSLLKTLQQRYPLVVLDLATGCSDEVLAQMAVADQVLLVTTLDPPALRRARLGLDVLRGADLEAAERAVVVANRVRPGASLTRPQVEAFLSTPLAIELPEDAAGVGQALAEGEPAVLRNPDSGFAVRVEDLARALGFTSGPRPRPTSAWLNRLAWR